MPAAISSLYKTSIALAGAGIIAVSPLVPSHDARIATVHLPEIQLTDLTVPAFGAIPYQIGINALGDIIAAAPILIGSTQQCATYCLGPNTPAPAPTYAPFTGWGLVGLGQGLISSPVAFITALQAGQNRRPGARCRTARHPGADHEHLQPARSLRESPLADLRCKPPWTGRSSPTSTPSTTRSTSPPRRW